MVGFAQSANNKKYVLGIDVGGQSIKPELFEVKGGKIVADAAWKPETTPVTQMGLAAHTAQMADIIAQASEQAERQLGGTLIAVSIGSPGRFRADGTIKPGTSPNMGETITEFDNVNLEAEYRNALKTRNAELAAITMKVGNDGNAMLAGMIDDIVNSSRTGHTKPPLHDQDGNEISQSAVLNKRVALFGIGTGLGHAIVDVDGKGGVNFVTDGHASKLRVKVDAEDLPMLEKAKKIMNQGQKPEVVDFPDNTVRAEDLVRDPVLKVLAGVSNAKDIDWANDPEHDKVVRFAGKYMARLAALIKSGNSVDVDQDNGWSADEKAEAAKTQYYLIGGGVGGKPLGAQMIRYASDELKRLGIDDVKLVQYDRENPATRAAATMLPVSALGGARNPA